MKKIQSLILATLVAVSCCTFALAASNEAITAANDLYSMGLFTGTGTNKDGTPIFDLDRAPNRYEAVTMLVRLLGKEAEAKERNTIVPFKDVAQWASPYVSYAYEHNLTSGVSSTAYGGTQPVTATQYLTFVLRALGYESGVDFEWNKAWELSDKINLTDGRYNDKTASFTRGDVAIISSNALQCKTKGTDSYLKDVISNSTKPTSNFHSYTNFPKVPDYEYYYSSYVGTTSSCSSGFVHVLSKPFDTCKSDYIDLLSKAGYSYTGNSSVDNQSTVISDKYTLWSNRLENKATHQVVYVGRFEANGTEAICIAINTPPQGDMIAYLQGLSSTLPKTQLEVLAQLSDILADYGDMEQEALTACQNVYKSQRQYAAIYAEVAMQYKVTMASAAYKGAELCRSYPEFYNLQVELVNLWAAADALTGYTITTQNAYSYANLVVSASSDALECYQRAVAQYQKIANKYL